MIGIADDLVAVVKEGVVVITGDEAVVDVGWSALGPVLLVVEVGDASGAAGEAAVAVAHQGGSSLRGGPHPCLAFQVERFAVLAMMVGDDRSVTGDLPSGLGVDWGAIRLGRYRQGP